MSPIWLQTIPYIKKNTHLKVTRNPSCEGQIEHKFQTLVTFGWVRWVAFIDPPKGQFTLGDNDNDKLSF
jgi:hypothetical protein